MDNKWKAGFFLVFMTFQVLSAQKGFKRPPGTVQIAGSFYADVSELTNISYREYLYHLAKFQGKDSEVYQNAIPDSTVWKELYGEEDKLMQVYSNHPTYDEYPVVGVSHQQAQDYCKWRSKVVMEMYQLNFPKEKDRLVSVKYRLPSAREWLFIARLNQDKSGKLRLKNKDKGKRLYNLRRGPTGQNSLRLSGKLNDNACPTAPVISYLPGKLEIFNLYGNIAEMVTEEGEAYGGSWIHNEREALADQSFPYDGPSYWLGFRCVCEVVYKD